MKKKIKKKKRPMCEPGCMHQRLGTVGPWLSTRLPFVGFFLWFFFFLKESLKKKKKKPLQVVGVGNLSVRWTVGRLARTHPPSFHKSFISEDDTTHTTMCLRTYTLYACTMYGTIYIGNWCVGIHPSCIVHRASCIVCIFRVANVESRAAAPTMRSTLVNKESKTRGDIASCVWTVFFSFFFSSSLARGGPASPRVPAAAGTP